MAWKTRRWRGRASHRSTPQSGTYAIDARRLHLLMKWVGSFFDFELFRTPSSPAQNIACWISHLNAAADLIKAQVKNRSLLSPESGLLRGLRVDEQIIYHRHVYADVVRALDRLPFDVVYPEEPGWRHSRLDGATQAAAGVIWTSGGKLCLRRKPHVVFEPDELDEAMAAARKLSPRLQHQEAQRLAARDWLREVDNRLDDDVPEAVWSDDDAGEAAAPPVENSRGIALDMVTQLERDLAGKGINVQLLANGRREPPLYLADLGIDPTEKKRELLAEAQRLWARAKAETEDLGSWSAQHALARFDELAAAFKPKLLRYAYKLDADQASHVANYMQFVATIRFDLANWDGLLLAPRPIAVLAASKPGFWTAGDEEAFRYYYKMARQTVDYHFQRSNTRALRYYQRPDDPLFSPDHMELSDDESS